MSSDENKLRNNLDKDPERRRGSFVGTDSQKSDLVGHFESQEEDVKQATKEAKASKATQLGSKKSLSKEGDAKQPVESPLIQNHEQELDTKRKSNQPVFNLTQLIPLPPRDHIFFNSTRKKKVVELIDKATGQVIVCFRGIQDAGHALGVERRQIAKACQMYVTSRNPSEDDRSLFRRFDTFFLRYGLNGSKPVAYLYGAHDQDFEQITETQEQRIARFRKMHKQDMKKTRKPELSAKHKILTDDKTVSAATKPPKKQVNAVPPIEFTTTRSKKDLITQSSNTKQPSLIRPSVLQVSKPTRTREEPLVLNPNFSRSQLRQGIADPRYNVQSSEATSAQPSELAVDFLCLLCQTNNAQVVFEPCRHCVMCVECGKQLGFLEGSKFCPSCRVPITGSSTPVLARLIRPRIYSAFCFTKS